MNIPTDKLMGIPKVRKLLLQIAIERDIPELVALEKHLYRRPPVRRTDKKTSRPMTPEVKEEIRVTADRHPDMSMHEVSMLCGVNQGRISETLGGKRS
jgi:hypothetical protein